MATRQTVADRHLPWTLRVAMAMLVAACAREHAAATVALEVTTIEEAAHVTAAAGHS